MKEVLKVTLITFEGYYRTYTNFYKRNIIGGIVFEDTKIDECNPGNYLQPIIRAWDEMKINGDGE